MTVAGYVSKVVRSEGWENVSLPDKDAPFLAVVVECLCRIDRVDLAFDIADGLYWFCSDWHGGQGDELYAVLSTLDYRPGMTEGSPDEEEEDSERLTARMVYESLCRWYGYGSETIG